MHSVALPGGISTGDMSLKHSPSSPDHPEPLGRATFHMFGAHLTVVIGVGKCIPLCVSQRTVVRMLLRAVTQRIHFLLLVPLMFSNVMEGKSKLNLFQE